MATRLWWMRVLIVFLGVELHAQSRATYQLISAAQDYSAQNVETLEVRVRENPDDRNSRVLLLAYYSKKLAAADPEAAVRGRAPHLLWLVQNRPKDDVLRHYISLVNSRGDSLPDPELYRAVREGWRKHLRSHPPSKAIIVSAARFLAVEEPPAAARAYSLIRAEDGYSASAPLGRLCAYAVLGLKGFNHLTATPTWADPALSRTEFAADCRSKARTSTDPQFMHEFARMYYRAAGPSYASELLEQDYTVFGAQLLRWARKMNPESFALAFLPEERLPERGAEMPMTVRIRREKMEPNLIRMVRPDYSAEARRLGVTGSVEMDVGVGLDGKVLAVLIRRGPEELRQAAEQAVRQWRYRPPEYEGRPIYAVTRVTVGFRPAE